MKGYEEGSPAGLNIVCHDSSIHKQGRFAMHDIENKQ